MFAYTNVVGEVGWIDAKADVTRAVKLENSSTLATLTLSMKRGT